MSFRHKIDSCSEKTQQTGFIYFSSRAFEQISLVASVRNPRYSDRAKHLSRQTRLHSRRFDEHVVLVVGLVASVLDIARNRVAACIPPSHVPPQHVSVDTFEEP
jgi:hypothetical protein